MGRERRLWSAILISFIAMSCCTDISMTETTEVHIEVVGDYYRSRSYDPDEQMLGDITLLVYDEYGNLEFSGSAEKEDGSPVIFSVPLLTDRKYSFFACANFGFPVTAGSKSEIKKLKWYMVYPDEYREGMAMAGQIEDMLIEETAAVIRIPLKRLMAKVSLRIDRSRLDEDVRMDVVYAEICNCPKSVNVFTESKVENNDECFSVGFIRNQDECSILNRNAGDGISGSLSLYMFENMQGRISSEDIMKDEDKVLGRHDIRQETASYLEIGIDYSSDRWHTVSTPLIYRLYLGEDRNSLDVERNCHYHITVIPENDGLSGDGWRVEKKGLEAWESEKSFNMHPSGYIEGCIGDTIKVRCSYHPSYAPFDIGMEELEYDRDRGIYDYIIDDDGLGVSLILKSAGTGILHMGAGEPVNETGILVIVVNTSKKI